MERSQRNTVILAMALLGVLLLAFGVQHLLTGGPGVYAVVQVGGETVATLDLSREQTLLVGDQAGDYNLVRVKDGAVLVEEADCPDRICVLTGPICQEGEVIACLPHGMLIFVESEGAGG